MLMSEVDRVKRKCETLRNKILSYSKIAVPLTEAGKARRLASRTVQIADVRTDKGVELHSRLQIWNSFPVARLKARTRGDFHVSH